MKSLRPASTSVCLDSKLERLIFFCAFVMLLGIALGGVFFVSSARTDRVDPSAQRYSLRPNPRASLFADLDRKKSFFASSTYSLPSPPPAKFAVVTNQISGPQGGLSVIDLSAQPVALVSSVANLDSALDVALTPDGTRALVTTFPSSTNTLGIVDLTNLPPVVTSTIPIGGTPTGLSISRDGSIAVACDVTNRRISVVDLTAAPPAITAAIPVGTGLAQGGPRDVVITSDNHYALVAFGNSFEGQVLVVDITQTTPGEIVSARIPVGNFPIKMGANPDRSIAVVNSIGNNTVAVLDLSAFPFSRKGTVSVGHNPGAKPDVSRNGLAVVPNSDDQNVSIIDAAATTPAVIATVSVGRDPRGATIVEGDNVALVANRQDSTISRIDLNTFTSTILPLFVPVANHLDVHEPSGCPASLAISGSVPDFCESASQPINLTLNGNNLSGATISWSLTGPTPNPNLGSGTNLITTLSGLAPGSYSIVATASTSGCPDASASTSFMVRARPLANAGPDQAICESTSTTLAGNVPALGTGTWSLVGGSGTIVDPHNPATQVTNLGYGSNFFRWTVDDGTCQNGDDIVGIDRQQTPTTPNAGPDQILCEMSTATLTGNTAAVGFAIWELVSGVGTITDPFAATTTVTGLGYGTNLFQRKIDNGSCGALIDQMTVTRNHDTSAPSISCPANIFTFTNLNGTGAVVNYALPIATDDCSVPVVSCSTPSGSSFPLSTTTVNCTATDSVNNSASCSFTVTVSLPPSPTTFVVDSTGDGGDANTGDGFCNDGTGHCTLRAAIQQANATATGTDTIAFNIPGPGVHTITPATSLNNINQPVIIDGYTQPGSSPNTLAAGDNAVLLIEINGANVAARGFQLNASGNTIRGLVINRFGGNGIQTAGTSAGNFIEGNFIGTDTTGLIASANGGNGVLINGSSNNTIGGATAQSRNVIAGNTNNGVSIAAAVASNVVTAQSSNNLVQGNLIGTNRLGTGALGNRIGVFVTGSSTNTIGGTSVALRNIISGNRNQGIAIQPGFHTVNGSILSLAANNTIQGNLIGTDVTGTQPIGNGTSGSFAGIGVLGGSQTMIGGTTPGAGNVVSNNTLSGINLQTANVSAASSLYPAQQNVVQGNYVGTDITGTVAMPNLIGISILGGDHNLIGGTTAAARNVSSGNTQAGIWLGDNIFTNAAGVTLLGATQNNTIQGNYVGTNAAGTSALANNIDGVRIDSGASDNLIGGTEPGAGNLLSGNVGHGVHIDDAPFGGVNRGTARNTIQGNLIGTDLTGTQPLGNHGPGVIVFEGASDNLIGGTAPGAGNVIAFNLPGVFPIASGSVTVPGVGVSIAGSTASAEPTLHNHVTGNSIFGNDGIGIDINLTGNDLDAQDGATANDACDVDQGANNLQNAPVLSSVCVNGNTATVQGTLNSAPNTTFTIEFFANSQCDGSGSGEGQTYLGSIQVTTDQDCTANFTFSGTTPAGQSVITANATDPNGNTSEFSSCQSTGGAPVITLNGANPLTVECHGSFIDPGATAIDACGGSLVATATGTVDSNTPGSYSITYSASSGSQTSTATRTVIVVDTTPPAITCPANVSGTAGLGATSLLMSYASPTAIDSCSAVTAGCSQSSGSLFPVGNTAVTCTATDTSNNAASCSFTVTVLTPAGATQQVVGSVDTLVSQGILNQGQGQSLDQKLASAVKSLNQSDIKLACNDLAVFINQVNGFMRAGKLTAAQGQSLIDSANAIMRKIGC